MSLLGDQLESRMCTLTKKNVLLQDVVALISCILIIKLEENESIFLLAKKWGQRAKKECYKKGSVSNPFFVSHMPSEKLLRCFLIG